MRRLPVALATIFLGAITIAAQPPPPKNSIGEVEKSLSAAYKEKKLAGLDAKHLISGNVKVVIEHSLIEGKGQFEVRQFKTLGKIDQWLKSREREDGSPFRNLRPLKQCSRGRCAYDFDGGILHNQLYLHDVYYATRNGRVYITKIHLLDGD